MFLTWLLPLLHLPLTVAAVSPYFHLHIAPTAALPLRSLPLSVSGFSSAPFVGFFETPRGASTPATSGAIYQKDEGRLNKVYLQTQLSPVLPKWKVLVGEGKNHTMSREMKTRWREFEVVRVGKKNVLRFEGMGGWRACKVPGVVELGLYFGAMDETGVSCYAPFEMEVVYLPDENSRGAKRLEALRKL